MTTALLDSATTLQSTAWKDDLLTRICVRLQLTRTQYEAAKTHYLSVAEWLAAPESAIASLRPEIYPQGSLRIGTTVKPWGRDEYDLDFVLWLALYAHLHPVQVLDAVELRLRGHGTYAPMVERKSRCIRLNFAGQFHLDILPARPDLRLGGTHVLVPDCVLHDWKESNPKGFAEWFESRAALQLIEVKRAAAVEPLPMPEGAEDKNALQLAVQLLKRWRDIRFAAKPEEAPISIVLTTLAATHYAGETRPLEALHAIVGRINRAIPGFGRLIVCNPANPLEDLSERWNQDAKAYQSFVAAMREIEGDLTDLQRMSGTANVGKSLEKLFGETAQAAIREQVEAVEKARKSSQLGVSRGGAITAAVGSSGVVPVRRNTFYGS
jgi:hypothetical protein